MTAAIDWAAFDWQSFATMATGGAAVVGATMIGFRQVDITRRQASIAEAQAWKARRAEMDAVSAPSDTSLIDRISSKQRP